MMRRWRPSSCSRRSPVCCQCTDADALPGLYCLSYVVRLSDVMAAQTPDAICYPVGMPDDQPRRAFVPYLTAHPEARIDHGP